MNKNTVRIVTILFSLFGMNAYASSTTNSTPSQDAYDACNSLRSDEICHFKQNGVTVSGTCQKDQSGKPVCVVNK